MNGLFLSCFKTGLPILTPLEIRRLNEDYEKGWEPFHGIAIQFNAFKAES